MTFTDTEISFSLGFQYYKPFSLTLHFIPLQWLLYKNLLLRKHTMCSAINKTLSDRCTVSGVRMESEKSSLSPWDLRTSPTTNARALGRDMRMDKRICIGNNIGFPYSLNSRRINLSCRMSLIIRGEVVTLCYAHDTEIKWQTHTASLLQFSDIVHESIKDAL